jgi:flagellar biosynthesis/type III secretory pathway protein FliH
LNNVPREVVPIEVMEEEVQKSYDKGFEDGQISETAVAKAEINNFVEKMRTLEGVTQEFDKQSNQLIDTLYNSTISLAQAIAKNILKVETLDNFDLIEKRVQTIIEEVKGNKVISVRLHPETIEYIESSNKLSVVSDSKKVEIIPDENLKLSDVIVNTDSGLLIAKVEEELNKLISKLEEDFKLQRAKQIQKEIDDIENSTGNDV